MDLQSQLESEYTLAELNALLQKECAEGLSTLPNIDNYVFATTPHTLGNDDSGIEHPGQLCDIQLLLGKSSGEYTAHKSVYLCLERESDGKLVLNCDKTLYRFNLNNLSYVDLDPSYHGLLRNEDQVEVLHEIEKKRLRAYGYYLFLSAGHVQTVKPYHRFGDDLKSACNWFAKGIRKAEEAKRPQEGSIRQNELAAKSRIIILKYSKGSRAASAAASARENPISREQKGRAVRRKRTVPDNSDEGTPQCVPNESSVDDNLKILLECFETTQKRLLTFESAYNALQHDAESVGELKETIKQQEEEVSDLKRQLQDKDDRIGVLESESVKLQQVAEKEKAARKEEVKQRERAETRLSDYLEEQQQMAKKYFTP